MSSDSEPLPHNTVTDRGVLPGRFDCFDALDRLIRGGALVPESRNFALLAYLIEHYLAFGPGVQIKAYSIAVDVLERSSKFDPSVDSIVRVEVGRLRKLLEMYFLGPGRDDPVRLQLPKGQTHLEIFFFQDARSITGRSVSAVPAPPMATNPSKSLRISGFLVIAAVMATMLIAAILALTSTKSSLERDVSVALDESYPRVFVRPFSKSPELRDVFPESGLSSFVASELAAFRSFRVISPLHPSDLAARPLDFVLDGSFLAQAEHPANSEVVLFLQLRDGLGTVLWSEHLAFGQDDLLASEQVFAALSELSTTLGGSLGVIDSAGRARLDEEQTNWAKGASSDFLCFLRWQAFDLTKDIGMRVSARACLEDRAARNTSIGQIWAAVAFMRFLDWTEAGAHPNDPQIEAALIAANRALLIAPHDPEGYEAMGSIQTGLGNFDAAGAALERALEINPSNLETIVKLGWLDCLYGDWSTGTTRIRSVTVRYSSVPGWYRLPLALAALRDGDVAALQQEANAIIAAGDHRGLILALAAARISGDKDIEAHQLRALNAVDLDPLKAIAEIEALFPDDELFSGLKDRL
jgi:tetratricopeptide (TPR) repeat protein